MNSSNRLLAVVSVPKFGLLRHVGVLLPNGQIVHCAPNRGEHLTTPEEFANGEDVTIEELVAPNEWTAVLTRVSQALSQPQPYHPSQNNCEMFVNRMIRGQAVSPQLRGMVGLLLLICLGTIAARQ